MSDSTNNPAKDKRFFYQGVRRQWQKVEAATETTEAAAES